MLDIVKQVIDFYYKNFNKPKIEDLEIKNKELLEDSWSIFVTLYLDWIIKWSSGNIKEIKENIVLELIENTVSALEDSRFVKASLSEKDNLKIRIDDITNRWKPLSDWDIKNIDPTKYWVLVIKSDYEKSAVILPNISWGLMTWEDFAWVLSKKLWEDFDDKNYLVYKIETKVESNL